MNKIVVRSAVFALALLAALPALAADKPAVDAGIKIGPAIKKSGEQFSPDRIIVKFRNSGKPFELVSIPQGKVGEKVKEFLARADVEYAEPDYIAHALMVPDDTYYKYQWNFGSPEKNGINMENAWDVTAGSNSVVVAVVDTGIAYETYGSYCIAPDLGQAGFVAGYNFVNNTAHANDDNGHGTHVSGTIAQNTNNSLGAAGIAFNTKLMPVKVLNSSGSGTYSAIVNGIRFAVDHGAKVVNLSLGGSSGSQALYDALKYAYDNGVTVVAACGNNGSSAGCSYPAAYSDVVISVGATQYDGTRVSYSNYGSNLNIVAPGGNTSVDQNGDGVVDGIVQQTIAGSTRPCTFGYYLYQGTSMATPHVAGIAALLIANGNAVTPAQIKTAIDSTAKDLGAAGRDDVFGYGLADAYAALRWTDAPACADDAVCNDGKACNGVEVCQAGKCIPGNAIDCSSLNNKCNTGSCSEMDGGICVAAPKADGISCDDGTYCNGTETCQAGVCAAAAAVVCNDNNECTNDSCSESAKACSYVALADNTSCSSNGLCCAGICKPNITACVSSVVCWKGTNQYLLSGSSQAKKFCKCAQGTYAYKTYKYSIGKKTVWKYASTANDVNWAVSSTTSNLPVYSVTCSDSKVYPTNVDYSYPK